MGKKSHDSSLEYDEESEEEYNASESDDSEDDEVLIVQSDSDSEPEQVQRKGKAVPISKNSKSNGKNKNKIVEVNYEPEWVSTKAKGALGKSLSNTKQSTFANFISTFAKDKNNGKQHNEDSDDDFIIDKKPKNKMKPLVSDSSEDEKPAPKKKPNLVLDSEEEDDDIIIELSDEEDLKKSDENTKRRSSEISIDLDLEEEEDFRPRKRMKKHFEIVSSDEEGAQGSKDEEIDLTEREVREMDDEILSRNLNLKTREINFSEATTKKMRVELVRRNSLKDGKPSKKNQAIVVESDDENEGEGEEKSIDLEEEDSDEEDVDVHIDDLIEGCKKYSQGIMAKLKRIEEKNDGIKQPPSLMRKLKSYQIIGLNWLALIHEQKLNGILADEMGLGKTVQTISLLAHLRTVGVYGPHIVIVPASTMMNWDREFSEWCPEIEVLVYHGSQKERQQMREEWRNREDKVDVIITTYNIIENGHDLSFLKKVGFHYCILDEAHSIKNAKSLRYKKISKIKSKNRLLLTGTPLQNNLQELWALLNFLMPRMFDQETSSNWIKEIDEMSKRGEGAEKIEKMKAILSPFILRRLKSEVFQELPKKTEHVIKFDVTKIQNDLYKRTVESTRATLRDRKKESKKVLADSSFLLEEDGEVDSKKEKPQKTQTMGSVITNSLMELRKIVCHPALTRSVFDQERITKLAKALKSGDIEYSTQRLDHIIEDLSINSDFELHQFCSGRRALKEFCLTNEQLFETSSKFDQLKKLIPKIIKRGDKMLIFSQFTKVLDILETFLNHLEYTFIRLDGQTPVVERQDLIDKFNSEKIPIFLISTKAGGVGINLTAANVAIFYDISFNYTVDKQAEDRCHRLGQEKPVDVYRLIANDTIEEGMLEMAVTKKKVNDRLLEEDSFHTEESETKSMKRMFMKLFDGLE